MAESNTTIAVQRLLDDLGPASSPADDPVVRALLERSVTRLHQICSRLLHRDYPRLTRRPALLDSGDLLGALISRLLRALQEIRPRSVRQFFGLVNKHLRWELNAIARRIDQARSARGLSHEPQSPQPPTGDGESSTLHRILLHIESLPEGEREVFELVRIQGLTHAEAAEVLQVSQKTIQRRLRNGLLLLTESLGDLVGEGDAPAPPDASG
jgi:RNA polymerase sigma factor (sigma-70 family)